MDSYNGMLSIVMADRQDAILRFNGQEITWNVFAFDRKSRLDPNDLENSNYDVFEQINSYFLTLPIEQQQNIFNVYKEIYELLERSPADLDWSLRKLVAKLYDQVDLQDIRRWVSFVSRIRIPDDLQEIYDDSPENNGSRNRTYLREDYKSLLALSVALRMMIPVWGEYILRVGKEKGTTYKEFYAARLLLSSKLYYCEAMEKLRVFVEETIPTDKPKDSASIVAFSEDDFNEWMTSLVLVRRITVGDIRGLNPKTHLIKNIFQYIRQKFNTHENNFIGKVKAEDGDNNTGDDYTNLSKIETYKMRQELPTGDVIILRHSVRDAWKAVQRICPSLPAEMLEESLQACYTGLRDTIIGQPQIALAQYVYSPVLRPTAFMHLKKRELVQTLAVSQAILWKNGWHDLAALVSASAIPQVNTISVSSTVSRTRISKEQMAQLEHWFPYSRKPHGKQKQLKLQNVGAIAVESLFTFFTSNDWRLNLPERWLQEQPVLPKAKRYVAPYDIRTKLADFVILVASQATPFFQDTTAVVNKE